MLTENRMHCLSGRNGLVLASAERRGDGTDLRGYERMLEGVEARRAEEDGTRRDRNGQKRM